MVCGLTRWLAALAAGAILMAGVFAAPRGPADPKSAQLVNERFALSFCYAQYRDQTDIARCLLRHAPS
jgi:hypothetical protein